MTLQYLIPDGLKFYCDLIYTRGSFGYNCPIIASILMSDKITNVSYYPINDESYVIIVESDILINIVFNSKLNNIKVSCNYFNFTIIKTDSKYIYQWQDEYYHDYQIMNKIYIYICVGITINLEWKDEIIVEHQHYAFTIQRNEKTWESKKVLMMSVKSKIISRPILKHRNNMFCSVVDQFEHNAPLQDNSYVLAEEFRENFEFLVGKDIMIKNYD